MTFLKPFPRVIGSLLLLISLLCFTPKAHAYDIEVPPAPDGYVLDQAEVLSTEIEAALQSKLAALQAFNSTQMVVVTLSTLNGIPIEWYSLEIGRKWGVGQEDFNNGLVFLIAVDDREARIEVGYGLEGVITDAQSYAILNDVVLPYFQAGNYDQGVLESVDYFDQLARGETFEIPSSSQTVSSSSLPIGDILWLVLFLGLPLIWALLSWFSSTKSWWIGGIFGGIIGIIAAGFLGLIICALFGLLLDFILSTFLFGKIKNPHGTGLWWPGGHRGGGSGGGFGGFGGGSFGGGGASGKW